MHRATDCQLKHHLALIVVSLAIDNISDYIFTMMSEGRKFIKQYCQAGRV